MDMLDLYNLLGKHGNYMELDTETRKVTDLEESKAELKEKIAEFDVVEVILKAAAYDSRYESKAPAPKADAGKGSDSGLASGKEVLDYWMGHARSGFKHLPEHLKAVGGDIRGGAEDVMRDTGEFWGNAYARVMGAADVARQRKSQQAKDAIKALREPLREH